MSTADFIVTKPSPRSVPETVARIQSLATGRGLKVFAVIDHSGEALSRGLSLRDTKVVIFGAPEAGTPVMDAAPLSALDLPLKVLVWDDDGQTQVSYLAPPAFAERFGLPENLSNRLAGIDDFVDRVVG